MISDPVPRTSGKMIWPERTGAGAATDIAGNDYLCLDGRWYPAGNDDETEVPPDVQTVQESVK